MRPTHQMGAAVLTVAIAASGWASAARADTCSSSDGVLVLGAMPLEVSPLLARADDIDIDRFDGHDFYRATLSGQPVVLAMTRIGMVNATTTAELAFAHYCFDAVLFSGVAGSTERIGDVTIADTWTTTDATGVTTIASVDSALLALADESAAQWEAALSSDVPVGDEACLCPGVETLSTPTSVGGPRRLVVGGSGITSDTYGGKALPCGPGAGDVFGCQPCLAPGAAPEDAAEFATSVPSYLDPGFFAAFFQPPAATTDDDVAQDQESGAVLAVAAAHGTPFLAVRGVSDGAEDPLQLPGFPFQFFAYRHLAANNAAAVTTLLLGAMAA